MVGYSYWSDSVTWLRNTDGLGDFSTGVDIATDGAAWVELADIDGDGDLDVISSYYSDGTFLCCGSRPVTVHSVGILCFPPTCYITNTTPLRCMNHIADRVTWYENINGLGTFAAGLDVSTTSSASMLAVADLNGDEDVDIVVASFDGNVTWFQNSDGKGAFLPVVNSALDTNGGR